MKVERSVCLWYKVFEQNGDLSEIKNSKFVFSVKKSKF